MKLTSSFKFVISIFTSPLSKKRSQLPESVLGTVVLDQFCNSIGRLCTFFNPTIDFFKIKLDARFCFIRAGVIPTYVGQVFTIAPSTAVGNGHAIKGCVGFSCTGQTNDNAHEFLAPFKPMRLRKSESNTTF